jgi:hypothetical protein
VAWASYELFRQKTVERTLPATAVKNEHFDRFGHALTGDLMCCLALLRMRQSSVLRSGRSFLTSAT